jgi:putative ABC transport system substrate-binding protein
MDRRRFLVASLAGVFANPLLAGAQATMKIRRVAVIYGSPLEMVAHLKKALEESLASMGYAKGHSLRLDLGTDGTPDQMRTVVAEVVASKPDLIVVWSTIGAVAVKRATTTIPVVFLTVGVPVQIVAARLRNDVVRAAASIMLAFKSTPTTRPSAPTLWAGNCATKPLPQATSSTR